MGRDLPGLTGTVSLSVGLCLQPWRGLEGLSWLPLLSGSLCVAKAVLQLAVMSKALHKSKCCRCLLWLMWEENSRVRLPLFEALKWCGIILLWDEECFRWMRHNSSLVSGASKWITQVLAESHCYGRNTRVPLPRMVSPGVHNSELLAPLRSARQWMGSSPSSAG